MVVEGRKWRPGCPSSLHGMFTEEPRKPGMKFEVGNGGEKLTRIRPTLTGLICAMAPRPFVCFTFLGRLPSNPALHRL